MPSSFLPFGIRGRTRWLMLLVFAGLLTACSAKKPAASGPGKGYPLRVQLDWFPEPEHGGLYQALAQGYFAQEGLDVKLLPGGNNVLVTQFVGTGQAEIGQSATTQVIYAVNAGLPVTCVASLFHRMPSGLLMHADNPISTFSELNGKTIMGRPEGVYIPYLKKKYGINFTVVPQNYGLAQFIQDPKFIQEGYFIAEPYFIEKEGVKVKWLAFWDSGYDPATTLFAHNNFAKEHPEQLRAFLRAYVRGWKEYLEGDPTPGNTLMRQQNQKLDADFLKYSRDQIIKYHLGSGDPAQGENYGTLSPAKIQNEIAIMQDLGLIQPGKVTLANTLHTDYLPGR